jgi:PAS domain S-box-containing protein
VYYKGKPVILASVRDITDRKKAEETLRESEIRYKIIFDKAAEGIVVVDLETKRFRYINTAMCRMFGYTEEELLRLGVADIHPKESLSHVQAEFEAQLRGEKTLADSLPCLRKDGTAFYVNVSSAPIVLDGRQCLVGFFTDITERKKSEKNLEEKVSELERMNSLMVGREMSMVELKEKIKTLEAALGQKGAV